MRNRLGHPSSFAVATILLGGGLPMLKHLELEEITIWLIPGILCVKFKRRLRDNTLPCEQ
jgi:hypothetical protein